MRVIAHIRGEGRILSPAAKDGPLRYGLGKAVCADGPKEGSQLGHGWGWLREVMPDAAHKVVDLGFHHCFSYGAEPPRLVTP